MAWVVRKMTSQRGKRPGIWNFRSKPSRKMGSEKRKISACTVYTNAYSVLVLSLELMLMLGVVVMVGWWQALTASQLLHVGGLLLLLSAWAVVQVVIHQPHHLSGSWTDHGFLLSLNLLPPKKQLLSGMLVSNSIRGLLTFCSQGSFSEQWSFSNDHTIKRCQTLCWFFLNSISVRTTEVSLVTIVMTKQASTLHLLCTMQTSASYPC